MTDHRYAAIKAAAKALTEIGLYNNEEGLDGPFGGTSIEGPFNIVVPTILHAAEEHIRAMIAQEILSGTNTFIVPPTVRYHDFKSGHATARADAARIAKGPQQ